MREDVFLKLYVAWTQGGSDEIYRNRDECFAWLKDGQTDGEDILKDMTHKELKDLAEKLCSEYENEVEEN